MTFMAKVQSDALFTYTEKEMTNLSYKLLCLSIPKAAKLQRSILQLKLSHLCDMY